MGFASLIVRQGFGARSPATAFVAAWLAGCASTAALVPSEPRAVPPSQSIVFTPPGTLGIIGVVERRYNNATEQLVVLETRSESPGQNSIRIQAFAEEAHSRSNGGLQDIPLIKLDMAGEARGTMSYADMHLSPYFVQNYYGPFGYSMGRTATGDTCMYAWQRIPPARRTYSNVVTRGAIDLRMQLCDRRWTEQQLLAVMLGLTIRGVSGVPIVFPKGLGQVGLPIAPLGVLGVGNVLKAPAPAPAPRQVSARKPRPEPASTGGATVSSPTSIPAPDPTPRTRPVIPTPPDLYTPETPEGPGPVVPLPNTYPRVEETVLCPPGASDVRVQRDPSCVNL